MVIPSRSGVSRPSSGRADDSKTGGAGHCGTRPDFGYDPAVAIRVVSDNANDPVVTRGLVNERRQRIALIF